MWEIKKFSLATINSCQGALKQGILVLILAVEEWLNYKAIMSK